MKHSKRIYPRSTRNVSRHTRTFRLRTPAELKFTNLHLCYCYRLQQNVLQRQQMTPTVGLQIINRQHDIFFRFLLCC